MVGEKRSGRAAPRVNDRRHEISIHRYKWIDDELLGNIAWLLSDDEIRAKVQATSRYMQAQAWRRRAAAAIDQLLKAN